MSDTETAPIAPKTPKALKGRGHAWLLDVKDAKKFVEDCPKEKQGQLWVKVRDGIETAFAEEDDSMHHQASIACKLLAVYPDAHTERNPDIGKAAMVLHGKLLSLYETPDLQENVAEALCKLLHAEVVPPAMILTKLLMWCVYSCSQPTVKKADFARLHLIRRFLSNIGWQDSRVGDFLGHVYELINPVFLVHPMGIDVMKILFAQNARLSHLLHKQFCIKATRACRFYEATRSAYTTCLTKVWDSLTGLDQPVFEHEVIKPFLSLAVKADSGVFFMFKELLILLRQSPSRRVKDGLNRLYKESDVLAGLDAPNGIIRRNCVALLGDNYPIGDGSKAEVEKIKIEQLNLEYRAAHDPCSQVRVAAVQGLLQIIGSHWGTLPNNHVLPILDKIFTKLAYDRDSSVRCAFLKGVKTDLLSEPRLHEILKKLVAGLTHLDDQSGRARLLYVQCVQEMSANPFFTLPEIVSETSVIRRIGVETNKQVLETLIKLASGVWKDDNEDSSIKSNVKTVLAMATNYPTAAFGLYGGLAGRSSSQPLVFLNTLRTVCYWLVGSSSLKTTKQVESVLAVVSIMLLKLKKKLLTKKRAKADALTIFTPELLDDLEEKFEGEGVTQILNQIRSVVSDLKDEKSTNSAELEKLANANITATDPSWKLILQKLVSCTPTGPILALVLEWLQSDDTIEKALLVTPELLYHKPTQATMLTEKKWVEVWTALVKGLEKASRDMRSPAVKEMKEQEARLLANQVELFGKIALMVKCAESNVKRAATKKKITPKGAEGEEEQQDEEVVDFDKTAKIMLDSLLPAAKRAKRNGGALPAVGVVEQVLQFTKRSISCYQLVQRNATEPSLLNAPQLIDTVLDIDPQFLSSVLDLLAVGIEMQVAHIMFQNWIGFLLGVLRKLADRCDELTPLPTEGSEIFTDFEDTNKRSWSYLQDAGLYRKHFAKFLCVVRTLAPQEQIKEMCDGLWVWGCETGGYSVAPQIVSEVYCGSKMLLTTFMAQTINFLARTQSQGKDIAEEDATFITAVFSGLLSTRNRGLVQTLVEFKTQKLDEFFKSHSLFSRTSSNLAKEITEDDDDDIFNHNTDQPTTDTSIMLLSGLLDSLDWVVPLPKISRKATATQDDEEEEDGATTDANTPEQKKLPVKTKRKKNPPPKNTQTKEQPKAKKRKTTGDEEKNPPAKKQRKRTKKTKKGEEEEKEKKRREEEEEEEVEQEAPTEVTAPSTTAPLPIETDEESEDILM
eukprot:TRINITY_DN4467_c2_g1_i1.p1 TRINITY_DN4467_c2_g1~~TRINITY_DN4467_c2_g1_i1.p1  ORF type:complete len:1246 (+),score=287.67 TRINITY_DN4467_c2_g1_i1:23-3739(+)